jgi:hypothetical protein
MHWCRKWQKSGRKPPTKEELEAEERAEEAKEAEEAAKASS